MLQLRLIFQPLPHHPYLIGILLVTPGSVSGLANHPYRPTGILVHPNLVKEIRKKVKHPLQPLWMSRGKGAVVSIEIH